MEPILTVAFIVAVTAFFKQQFGLVDKAALALAFVVSIVVGLAPQLVDALPALGPWIDAVIKVVVLFLSAAGSYDYVQNFRK